MALVYIDSFDHYQTADITTKWTSLQSTPTITTGGRLDQCLACTGEGVYKGLAAQTTYIVGAAFKPSSLSSNRIIFEFRSNADKECQVCVETSGALSVYRAGLAGVLGGGTQGTKLGPSSDSLLSVDVWAYVECQMTLSNTAAAWTIVVNGVTALSESGASGYDNVRNTASITSIGVGGYALIDDVYICDTTGSVNNTLLGDVTIQALLPEGNGTNSDFVGSDADSTDNYLLVDDSAPDGDTTFVQSATIGAYDTYVYPSLATTVSAVLGVQIAPCATKTDTGTRTYTTVVKLSGGSETDGAVTQAPSVGSYAYGIETWDEKPGTGAWSVSDVDNAEFGLKVSG